jgi:hypothetical protein
LNASGWAPKALNIEHLKIKGVTEMPQSGIDFVTVPGVVGPLRGSSITETRKSDNHRATERYPAPPGTNSGKAVKPK